mmetsp:Transcript_25317/g.60188  ORF Transcript_25317/g.60188 Transcript_25317/m.60188 type:complete len:378 (+) Transcript_25317:343-1476(+)
MNTQRPDPLARTRLPVFPLLIAFMSGIVFNGILLKSAGNNDQVAASSDLVTKLESISRDLSKKTEHIIEGIEEAHNHIATASSGVVDKIDAVCGQKDNSSPKIDPFQGYGIKLSDLPTWVTRGTPNDFAIEMRKGSGGLTDKVDRVHLFQFLYQPNFARMAMAKLLSKLPKIRLLEFGLGCAPGGGMIRGTPGGSALGWKHLFDQVPGLEFELHIFEYDKDCAEKWEKANPNIAKMVHIGDASSEEDLKRAYDDAGGTMFDVIIDDASNINWHQIKTLDEMLPRLATNGFYIVEDIISSCTDWRANMGTHRGDKVGGGPDCMTTDQGEDTILAHLMEYQRTLVGKRYKYLGEVDLHGVTKIEMHFASALLSKEVESV